MKLIDRFNGYEFHPDGFVISKIKGSPKILKPIKLGKYVGLTLKRSDGHTERAYLHRLICEAHLGPCPEGMECRHLDGNRLNNSASNLVWGTKLQNQNDKESHGTIPFGEKNPMAKLTESRVRKMRKLRDDTGMSYAKIAAIFGVSTMTAYRAISRKAWAVVK